MTIATIAATAAGALRWRIAIPNPSAANTIDIAYVGEAPARSPN